MAAPVCLHVSPDLPLLQLLCVHGAQRSELTELELDEMPEECRAWIRATWRWTSELHHLELLPPARMRELLVAEADCVWRRAAARTRSVRSDSEAAGAGRRSQP
jgi:hypothetical protein